MRAALRVFAVAVLLCAVSRADERILYYHSDITVRPDATLRVTETIRVNAENAEIRHGIYRDFPTAYEDRWGNRYNVYLTIVSAFRDGVLEAWHTEQRSNGVRIYLGDKNTIVSVGEHTYELTYTVTRELGFFPDHDELFWNVTGNGWGFPIDKTAAIVRLPASIPRDQIKLDGYTGAQGSREKALRAFIREGDPVFTATRSFGPNEGLSIVVSFPTGFITQPTLRDIAWYWMQDNVPACIGVVGLLLTFFYYVVVWAKVGRDPKAGTIMPIYDLPPQLSPAAVRYLKKMAYDDKVFAAAVIDLAVKKKVTIRQDSDDTYTIVLAADDTDSSLTTEEKTLRITLLGDGQELELKKTNWATVAAAVKGVKNDLQQSLEKIYFFSHGSYMIPGVLLSVLTAVVMVARAPSNEDSPVLFLCVWLSIWTFGVVMLIRNTVTAFSKSFSAGISAAGFASVFLFFEIVVIWILARSVSVAGVLLLIALAPLNLIFHHLLKAPTLAGRKLLDKIDGFRMFLSATEEDVLNRMNPPNRTPELFEKYLPFAVALDCEKAWGAQFATILAAAAVGGSQYSPSWYDGSSFSPSNIGGFTSSFSNGLSSAISSSSTAPGSASGAGAGGSGGSGGGGGGGGGGGW